MPFISQRHVVRHTALTLGVAAILAAACPAPLLAQPSKTGTRQPMTNCPPAKSQPNNAAQITRLIQYAREGSGPAPSPSGPTSRSSSAPPANTGGFEQPSHGAR